MPAFRRAVAAVVLALSLPACAGGAHRACSGASGDLIVALVELGLHGAVAVAEAADEDDDRAVDPYRRASAPTTPGGIPAEQDARARQQRAARAERERRAIGAQAAQQMSTLPLRP